MDVAVIGCGVIGLTTAILLQRRGYRVTIYASEQPPKVTSNSACAIWLPLWNIDPHITSLVYHKKLASWAEESWNEFARLANENGEKYGIRWKRNYEFFSQPESVPLYLQTLMDKGALFDFEVIEDRSLPWEFRYCWSFSTFVIETPIYMTQLVKDFRSGVVDGNPGSIVEQRLQSQEELCTLPESVVFNCTGLGARELFQDLALRGVKGQLLLHEPLDLVSAIGADDIALIPRSDALILGSLWQENYENEKPTDENSEVLWERVSDMLEKVGNVLGLPPGGLSRDKLIGSVAGLRPYRPMGIRLERENVNGCDKQVIHNYGHGGSGITLSWGTCLDAVNLLEE